MRLFLGIALPETLCDDLGDLMEGIPGARWAPPDMLHITLRFIGELDGRSARDIAEILGQKSHPILSLRLQGMGYFGDRNRARILWAGVEKHAALMQLQKHIEAKLQRYGLPAEKRRYRPHVTLARFRDYPLSRLTPYLEERGGYRSDAFDVASYILFSSHIVSGQPYYQPEYEFPLSDLELTH